MITNVKMEVTPELSKRVQKIVFANGGKWGLNHKKIKNTFFKYLYIDKNKKLLYGEDKSCFKKNKFKKVDVYAFIASQGEQEWLSKYSKETIFSDDEKNWHEKLFKSYSPTSSYPFTTKENINYKCCKSLPKTISFTKFLKENDAYNKYMHNVKIENQRWDDIKNYIKLEELKKQTPFDWICYAFDWELQKEGNDFWGYLNDKWLNIIEENNNKQIVWE